MELDEIVAVTFEPQLSALGFTSSSARRWVRETKSPIREIFRLQAMKGATYSCVWGFDLAYVPLYRSGKFRSKRTLRACDFDLTIDPIDEATDVPAWCSFGWLPGYQTATRETVAGVARQSIARAVVDFERVASSRDLEQLFLERSRMQFTRFGPQNYVQFDLAWGLLVHTCGRDDAGRELLARFCATHGASIEDPALMRAIVAAKSDSALP